MRLEIGTKLLLRPSICVDTLGRATSKPIEGTVVYINKPHRYFTAEFVFPTGGSFRESFKFYYKTDLAHKPKPTGGGGAFCNCKKKFYT